MLYLQTVFGMRPDVENLRKYGYLESGLFDEMPESLRTKIGPFPPRRFDPEIIAWLVDHTSRPVYLSKSMHLPTEQPVRIVPAGLTFRVLRPGESPPSCYHGYINGIPCRRPTPGATTRRRPSCVKSLWPKRRDC